MDDRFRNEGTDGVNSIGNDSYYPGKNPSLGDFSVNIDSKATADFNQGIKKPQKFEVHIADFEDEPVVRSPEKPVRPTQPRRPVQPNAQSGSLQRRAAARTTAPNARPVNTGAPAAKRPVRAPQKASSAPAAKRSAASNNVPPVKKAPPKKAAPTAQQKKKTARNFNIVKGLLATFVCLIFITIITVSVSTVALSFINDVLVIGDTGTNSVLVEIPEGAEYEEVFEVLKDEGLIKQPLITNLFCKFRNYHEIQVKDEDGNLVTKRIKYEPGPYYLDADAGVEKMLETIMVRGNTAKDTVRLTFPEGWSIAQIFQKIEKYGVCEADKLYANLDFIGNQYDFLKDIEMKNGRYLKAEGYLFPDTYDFFIGENASSVIKKLINNYEAKWQSSYNKRLKELGMTRDEIMNIAAMIQREAKDSTQMAVISSVVHNRLKDSATYPNLEMNSTKDYISSLKQYNLFSDVYYSMYLDKYNTYSQPGLPPGPICNPGIKAIEAALYPADTDYYFFCHDTTTGEIYLAETAAEHQVNTSKVLYGNIGG